MEVKKTKVTKEVSKDIDKSIAFLVKVALYKHFSRLYLLISLVILATSTTFWSYLSASVHNSNSDQLVNAYLFRSVPALQNSLLPSAHTFLIKWPLYFLINILGAKPGTLIFITILSVLATVGLLAFIISQIERRPIILGTIVLLLASCLMLVPSVPHPGNLIPLNMAMLATRNLEYILYIFCLWIFIKYNRLRDWRFWIGVILLATLVASDKLFMGISIVGALLALITYSLSSGWNLVSMSVRWLLGSFIATLGAFGLLEYIKSLKLAHIVNSSSVGPYSPIHSLHSLVLSLSYAAISLFSNFGANPASGTTVLGQIPKQAATHLLSLAGLAFSINFIFLAYGLYCSWQLIAHSFRHNKDKEVFLDDSSKLSITLIWSTIAAVILFSASDHYYAADARYLTIAIFAVFIAVATYSRQKAWKSWQALAVGMLVTFGLVLAVPIVIKNYNSDQAALSPTNQRNKSVVEAIQRHKVDVLVGDYWRVIPAKFDYAPNTNIMPLGNCTTPRASLTRSTWNYNLNDKSFAYLLTFDRSLTDFPRCTLKQVVAFYGRPNSSIVLAGNFSEPKEMLLFYDHGANKSAPVTPQPARGTATVVPIPLAELPYKVCSVPTILNIVAHQDDDLLFMNPDLEHDIRSGRCVRSVYLTAGDAGSGMFYWLSRQQGTEAAYSRMLGLDNLWVERVVDLGKNQFATIANPRGNSKISLVFMYLPDGNLKGQGFTATKFQSLNRLETGQIPSIQTVYTGSSYNASDLTQALTDLMHLYLPTEIRTQSNLIGQMYPDHSDHMAVGRFVQKAYSIYEQTQYENKISIPIIYYLGYTGHQSPSNVSGDDLALKEAAFLEYSRHDDGVCHSIDRCLRDPAYGAYLVRQYKANY